MPHHPERRATERQTNPARHIADARADARRLCEVIESLANLSQIGQLPSASDVQKLLTLARITEFHAARAVRSLGGGGPAFFAEESMPCL